MVRQLMLYFALQKKCFWFCFSPQSLQITINEVIFYMGIVTRQDIFLPEIF